MFNTIDNATSRAGDPSVEPAAQSSAIDNRAQIAREIKAAKDPEKLEDLVLRYTILGVTRNVATPDRLRSIEKEVFDRLRSVEKELIALRPGDTGFSRLVKKVVKEQGERLTGLWQAQLLNEFLVSGPANAASPEAAARRLRELTDPERATPREAALILNLARPTIDIICRQFVGRFPNAKPTEMFRDFIFGNPREALTLGLPADAKVYPMFRDLAAAVDSASRSPEAARTIEQIAASCAFVGLSNVAKAVADGNLVLPLEMLKQFKSVPAARAYADQLSDAIKNGLTQSRVPYMRRDFMYSLPNDQHGSAVRIGYAEGCITGAQRLAQEIGSGNYSGPALNQLTAHLNALCQNATKLSERTGFSDPVKKQLFSQLRTAATQLAGAGAAKQSDVLNAYAANILSSLNDKSQIATTLRAMGGVGANGAIKPNSGLAKFLQSALSGQSQFGIASVSNIMTPYGEMPQGVTSLLNAISGSGYTELMAGTLDTVMQWTIKNPTQAEVLASQDTGGDATGYRNALTSLLDKSFNQFVALNPPNPNAKLVRTMQLQTIADLQALSAVVMGPPWDGRIAGRFAKVFGEHAVQFAAYAADPAKYAQLDRLLAGGGDLRISAAVIFGQLMNGFSAGLNQSRASFLAQAHDAKAAADLTLLEARVVTDLLRAFGTGVLLASGWAPATASVRVLGTAMNTEKAWSVLGRIGLFSGSVGTYGLDAFFSDTAQRNQAEAEARAVQAVKDMMQTENLTATQLLQKMYNGWFSTISQLLGTTGQGITNGVMTGSNFAGAPAIGADVQDFFRDYNPLGYYLRQTGQYPSVR